MMQQKARPWVLGIPSGRPERVGMQECAQASGPEACYRAAEGVFGRPQRKYQAALSTRYQVLVLRMDYVHSWDLSVRPLVVPLGRDYGSLQDQVQD